MTIFRTVRGLEEWTPPEHAALPLEQRPVFVLRPLSARQRIEILKLNQAAGDGAAANQGLLLEAVFCAARAGIADARNLIDPDTAAPVVLSWRNAEVLGTVCRTLEDASLDLLSTDLLAAIGQHVFRRNLLEEDDRGKSSSPRP